MSDAATPAPSGGRKGKVIVGLIITALLALFIAINRDEVSISFFFLDAEVALWMALAAVAFLGFVVGFALGRSRYKS